MMVLQALLSLSKIQTVLPPPAPENSLRLLSQLIQLEQSFTALPAGSVLSVGRGVDTSWRGPSADYGGIVVKQGSFIHNNGHVKMMYGASRVDNRVSFKFDADDGNLNFYDLTLDLKGDLRDEAAGNEETFAKIEGGTTVVVENDFVIDDGEIKGSAYYADGVSRLEVRGDFTMNCSDLANGICANSGEWISYIFTGSSHSVTVATESGAFTASDFTFDSGAGGTITINSDLDLSGAAGSTEKIDIDSGTLNISTGSSITVSDIFTNNGAVTCGAGGFLQYATRGGVASPFQGTPEAGDDSSCYCL